MKSYPINNRTIYHHLQGSECLREYFSGALPHLRLEEGREQYTVHCCFHDDAKASLSVNVRTGLFCCHACQIEGSVLRFRATLENLTEEEVRIRFVEELRVYSSTHVPEEKAMPQPASTPTTTHTVTNADIERWHVALRQNPKFSTVLSQLTERGLTVSTIDRFHLGADIGTFSPGGQRGPCLVIPVFENGQVVAAKKIMHRDGKRYFNTSGHAKSLFNRDALIASTTEPVFITEGEPDAMRLTQEGLLAVSSAGGAGTWDPGWNVLFRNRDVVVVYDSDEAGRTGAAKVVASLLKSVSRLRDVDLFPGSTDKTMKDVTDYFRLGHTIQEFLAIVNDTPTSVHAQETDRHQESSSHETTPSSFPLREMLRENPRISSERIGELAFQWISEHGGVFVRTRHGDVLLSYEGAVIPVEEQNRRFEFIMFDLIGLTTATTRGRVVVKVLRAMGAKHGRLIRTANMIYSDPDQKTIFFYLNNDQNELLEITPSGINAVPNGLNERNVLVGGSQDMSPLTYVPLDAEGLKLALRKVEGLVMKNFACSEWNRLMVTSWTMCMGLGAFARTRPIMRFEGDSGSAKSSATDLIAMMVYGKESKAIASPAALYSDGMTLPIILLDNVEQVNITRQMYDFFLTSATGVTKRKRKQGTESEVTTETVRSLLLTNGIENVSGRELISRTLVVEFNRKKYGTDYSEEVLLDIQRERDRMMSAVFTLQSRVLKRIKKGDWTAFQHVLRHKFPNHSKERATGFLALMLLVMCEFDKALDRKPDPAALATHWLGAQDALSTETSVESDLIFRYLELLRHCVLENRNPSALTRNWPFPIVFPETNEEGGFQFECFASDLHSTFAQLMRGLTPAYAFKDAMQLGKRLSDGRGVLRDGGWEVDTTKRRKGRAVWRFKYEPIVGSIAEEFPEGDEGG